MACASCGAVSALVVSCLLAPPALLIVLMMALAVWLSNVMSPCDQPLDAWLGVYLAYLLVVLFGKPWLLRVLCRWSPSSAGVSAGMPARVALFQLLSPVVPFVWVLVGRSWVRSSATCSRTSPELHSFVSWFSSLAALGHGMHLCVTQLLASVVLCLARSSVWRPLILALAGRGLLRAPGGASPGTIDTFDLVEYSSEVFADPDDADDVRPQAECCICLQAYDSLKEIRRTPCGHYMHRECLGMWLQTSRTCPTCRSDLEGQHSAAGARA